MTQADNLTFRDFASQIFSGDLSGASKTLAILIGLPSERAEAAAAHFQSQTSDPSFMPKAMSLRTAVQGDDDQAIAALLTDCFGLTENENTTAISALRQRYPKS